MDTGGVDVEEILQDTLGGDFVDTAAFGAKLGKDVPKLESHWLRHL